MRGVGSPAPWDLPPLRARHPIETIPTASGGQSHGLQRHIPRRAAPGVNPTRPRGHSHGLQRRFPRSEDSRGESHRGGLGNRRSGGVPDFRHRGICLRCGPGTQKGQIPRTPGTNPTGSRGESHGGPLQSQIPRTQEANPTQPGQLQGRIPRPTKSRGTSSGCSCSKRQIRRHPAPNAPARSSTRHDLCS